MKSRLFSSCAAVSMLLAATNAFAQEALVAEAGLDTPDDNVIIVTANKREQTLQEIPIAVSVTSAATIEQAQIRDVADLQSVVPSLKVDQLQSSANTNFIIRGFGNGANNAGIEPSVGVFIDGVYRSRSAAQIGDLPNVQRIEVLRGPQSTLFGKNASAGVISIVTQEPQFTFGGGIDLTYGNFNTFVTRANVTGPISDTVAFSLAGNYNRADGYIRDLTLDTDVNDRNRYGIRAQLLFEPSADLSIRIIGDYDKIDENCCAPVNVLAGPTAPLLDLVAGGVALDRNNPFSYNVFNNFLSSNDIKNFGVSGHIDYDLGNLNLVSITAYRGVRSLTNQDSDFSAADLLGLNASDSEFDTFTQELRLSSDFDGPFNFLLGAYYYDEKITVDNALQFGQDFRPYGDALIQGATGGALNLATLEGTLGALDATSYAGQFFAPGLGVTDAFTLDNTAFSFFGTVDLEVTDRLTLTAGINYTNDRKDVTANIASTDVFSRLDLDAPQYAPFRAQALQLLGGLDAATAAALANDPAFNPFNGLKAFQFLPQFVNFPNAVEDGRTRDDKVTYTLRASYEIGDSINAYLSYATGFKASSFNLSRDSRPFPGDLAAIRAAGLATPNLTTGTRFARPEETTVYEFGIKGNFERAAFNVAIFEQEVKDFQAFPFIGTGFVLANAGKISTFGIEFEGNVTPVDPLNLFLSFTYLDGQYDSFVNSIVGDLSGQDLTGTSPISMSLGGTYTQPIGDTLTLIVRGDYQYESRVQITDGLGAFGSAEAGRAIARDFTREVNLINASATLQFENGFEFSVYGRNLTNSRNDLTTIFDSVVQQGSISGYPNRPRTYGATVRYKF